MQSMQFLLLICLILLPTHGGKRGPKVYFKKGESSEDYRRASAFFRPRTRPNECAMNEQSQQICAVSDSSNEPQEAENMDVEETTTHDEENQEVVERVENPIQMVGSNSEDISLSNDNPLTTNSLDTPVGKKQRKQNIPALYFLLAAGIVIPFSSADCERSFSNLNRIKSKERSKTGEELLRDLMLMYTMTTEEMRKLKKEKLQEMSEKLAHKVWKRPGKKIDSYFNNDFIV